MDDAMSSEESIRMTPEEENAALEAQGLDAETEPADEGVGAHTDAQDDSCHTEN